MLLFAVISLFLLIIQAPYPVHQRVTRYAVIEQSLFYAGRALRVQRVIFFEGRLLFSAELLPCGGILLHLLFRDS